MKIRKTAIIMSVTAALALQSCFTGIEYTPKITYKDVKKEDIRTSEEQKIADSFSPENFGDWKKGKQFFVSDPKISWVMNGQTDLQRGDTIIYIGTGTATSLTGGESRNLLFSRLHHPADTLYSRLTAPAEGDRQMRIPFAIELSVIDKMREALIGNRYYVKTALWYSQEGDTRRGRKFIPVIVTDVVPHSEEQTAMVSIKDPSTDAISCLLMSQNTSGGTRTFDTLFSIADPRRLYPNVTDENWTAIQNSQVREGMTRAEVQAALGAPSNIDRGHNQSNAFERWTYQDGISLIFVDGILTR